jgi:hypothetical protein
VAGLVQHAEDPGRERGRARCCNQRLPSLRRRPDGGDQQGDERAEKDRRRHHPCRARLVEVWPHDQLVESVNHRGQTGDRDQSALRDPWCQNPRSCVRVLSKGALVSGVRRRWLSEQQTPAWLV